MEKILTAIFLLLLLSPAGFAQEPQGTVIFSVEITDSELLKRLPEGTLVDIGKTGIFYYLEDARPEQALTITGYRYGDGNVIDVFGRGSIESENFATKLRSLPLSTFDVAAEVEKAIAIARAQAEQRGETYSPPSVRDGGKYKPTTSSMLSRSAMKPGIPARYSKTSPPTART